MFFMAIKYKCHLLSFVLCYLVIYSRCDEYENDEKMYMALSPDQHTHTPRLEDFFWTGSGDGPPPPPDPPFIEASSPTTPIVRTTTVLATVYLDSYPPQAVTDKTGECVTNCGEPVIPESLEPEIPEDRRYWLLTVIQGSTPDSLQLRLARLYQKAFLRQQERHLGIIKSLDAPTTRKKHEVHSFIVNKDNNFQSINTNTPLRYLDIQSSMVAPIETDTASKVLNNLSNNTRTAKNYIDTEFIPVGDMNIEFTSIHPKIEATKLSEIESWILAAPTVVINKREIMDKETLEIYKEEFIEPLEEDTGNETLLFKREIIRPEQQPPVQVHIQNVTESPETGSVQIVYIVLVGGRAVPAAVAAKDMRLVRDAEVAKELGAVVTTKAEPAYLKAAEGLEGEATNGVGVHGTELWALAVGASVAILILLALVILLCVAQRKKAKKSAASLRAYRNELLREAERNQLKQVHEEKDGKLISVVSPSRTRPSSTLLPVYRAGSTGSSSSSSGVSEVAAALRRRQKKPHALRMPQKKRVGTTDSLLEAAGLDSSDSGQQSVPQTPTSYLSMPSVNSFPRGNLVEPLSRILEPVSVRHLDIDSPLSSPKDPRPKTGEKNKEVIPRRQMASQLVRLGSIDKDPGVIGPLVWDLHCQRMKDASKPSSPAKSVTSAQAVQKPGPSRMRQRFNELMDDAFTLFGSAASNNSHDTYTVDTERDSGLDKKKRDGEPIAQARNDNVRLPGSPYTALDTVRGRSAGPGSRRFGSAMPDPESSRPRTSLSRTRAERRAPPPTRAWGVTPPHSLTSIRGPAIPTVNPALILAEGRLAPEDPAIPLISAIKSEIEKMRDKAQKPNI